MGIPQFLSYILETAGRNVDLQNYQGGIVPRQDERQTRDGADSQKRPLRIGIDVSSWIYKACQGHGSMLGDERHLTNYGRAALLQNEEQQKTGDLNDTKIRDAQKREMVLRYVNACSLYVIERLQRLQSMTNAEILVVLDGATPPIKRVEVRDRSNRRKQAAQDRDRPADTDEDALDRRFKAFRRAGAGEYYTDVVESILQGLRAKSIPFLVSPYESDGQLAFLGDKGYIDLIATEDSDLVAYGVKSPILYKLVNSLGDEAVPRGVLVRREDLGATTEINLCDFTATMLAVLFVAAGSDYCKKLKGIGVKAASYIVRAAFYSKREKGCSPLEVVFRKLYSETWDKQTLTDDFKRDYEKGFLAALLMFRHPVVFDPVHGVCATMGDPLEGDPQLISYPPYAELCRDSERRAAVCGNLLPSPQALFVAEGWLSARTFRPYPKTEIPSNVKNWLWQNEEQARVPSTNQKHSKRRKETATDEGDLEGDFETQEQAMTWVDEVSDGDSPVACL